MVYEEVTDDDEPAMPAVAQFSQTKKPKLPSSENEPVRKGTTTAAAPAGKKQAGGSEAGKKNATKQVGQQKNMMSFFAKKG